MIGATIRIGQEIPAYHLIVKMSPINMLNNKAARTYRSVTVRPMPQSAINHYKVEMDSCDWEDVITAKSAHEKAANLQIKHAQIVENCFPQKTIRVSSDDCPWWTTDLQELHRKKQRLYRKERKSLRWSILEKRFQAKIKLSKKLFYSRMVEDLIEKDQNQWYSQLKRLTNQGKSEEIVVDEINHLTDPQQAETIANHISSMSQEYDHLKNEDITIPYFTKSTIPHIRVTEVEEKIMMIKTKKSTANGDIPAKLIKVAAESIAIPLTNVMPVLR